MKKEESLVDDLINKQFVICNIRCVDILKWSDKKELPWYRHFTFTQDQYNQWKKYCLNILKKNKQYKSKADQVFAEIDLMWGLKVLENDSNN